MEEVGQGEVGAQEKKNHEQEEDEEKESRILQAQARQLESAILSLLRDHHPDASKWITDFVTLPEAWSVSLYLAFPPPETTMAVGRVPEARFFALNLLLAKIRSDWSEVAAADAREIYEVLWRQLPANLGNPMVAERLCLVVSSAAAMAGAETCYEVKGTKPFCSFLSLQCSLSFLFFAFCSRVIEEKESALACCWVYHTVMKKGG
jgi:hypothetical protein